MFPALRAGPAPSLALRLRHAPLPCVHRQLPSEAQELQHGDGDNNAKGHMDSMVQ